MFPLQILICCLVTTIQNKAEKNIYANLYSDYNYATVVVRFFGNGALYIPYIEWHVKIRGYSPKTHKMNA